MNFLKKLLKILVKNEWDPSNLLEYDERKECGPSYYTITKSTNFGEWLQNQIGILSLSYYVIHYIIFYPIWALCWVSFGISNFIVSLFTKKWKDV